MNTQNDRRIDELSQRTDKGFEEVKGEIKEVRQEMRDGFARTDQRIDRLTHTLMVLGGGAFLTFLGNGILG